MLPPSTRRSGLRQQLRPAPVAMEVEEPPQRSISKERMGRNFGTNLTNEIPRSSLVRLPQKFSLKNGKPNSRKTYRKESMNQQVHQLQQLSQTEPMLRKNQTSLYEQSIHTLLRANENSVSSRCDFLSKQRQVDADMRCRLVGWLIEVANQFQLKNETLFMCVNLLDRYLSEETVLKSQFQLLGISTLFIASKYEEIYPPHISKFVTMSAGSGKHQLLEMESRIILMLNFELISCTALRLLDMLCLQATELPPQNRTLAQFLLELALLEYEMCLHRPSSLALASLCLSGSLLQERCIEPHHLNLSLDGSIPLSELKYCFAQLFEVYGRRNCPRFQSVRARFSKQPHFDANIY